MTKRDWWVAAASALAVSTALAQAAKPKDDAAAEAAAAMERARKQAANPMRIILEASKAKKRAGEDTAPPAPASEASVRPVVNRTAPAAPAPEPVVARAAPAAASAPAPASPPPPAADPAPVVAQITLSSELAQSKVAESVPSLAPTGAASVAAPSFGALPAAAPSLEVAQAKPRLLSMVEPEVPQRLLDELGRNATVVVDMTIRPDGSVGNVTVASSTPRGLQRVLVNTIEQWRFAASPVARQHRVELVFNADR